MTIRAIALLRVSHDSVPEALRARAKPVEGGVLLSTDESFARDPEELSVVVRTLVGPALESEHRDARGILFLPDVAAPSAGSYEAIVEEVGEGGVWGPLVDSLDQPEGPAVFRALLGNLLGQLPSSLLASANAAAQGQPGAFDAMNAQLQELLGRPDQLEGLASQLAGTLGAISAAEAAAADKGGETSDSSDEDLVVDERALQGAEEPPSDHASHIGDMAQLAALLGGAGYGISSPALQQLAQRVHAELERDPSAVVQLAQQLMNEHLDEDE